MRTTTLLAAAALALPVCACASSPGTAPRPHATTAPARHATAPAVPDTAAAAKATARDFLSQYSDRQWDGTWRLLDAAGQNAVPESLWAAFHRGCPPKAAAMAVAVTGARMTGRNAVVTYTIPAARGAVGSRANPMTWTPGGWRVALEPAAAAVYRHGSLAADIKAARKAGSCAS